VSIYVIDLHVVIHICPADPPPHPVDIRRRIVIRRWTVRPYG
jgi:hypothetical protein